MTAVSRITKAPKRCATGAKADRSSSTLVRGSFRPTCVNATRMKNRFVGASPNCALSTMLHVRATRKPETACTIPTASSQERVRMKSEPCGSIGFRATARGAHGHIDHLTGKALRGRDDLRRMPQEEARELAGKRADFIDVQTLPGVAGAQRHPGRDELAARQ